MPRVSVILPNYNYARYLKERVRSILGQTMSDLELIYLDDASTDISNEIMAGFASDHRVRMECFEQNSGAVYRRWNDGAKLARGEWLWFAGADDAAAPRLLERLLDHAALYPDAAIVYANTCAIDAEGRLTVMQRTTPDSAALLATDGGTSGYAEIPVLCNSNWLWTASSLLIRRDAFEEAGGWDDRLRQAADVDLYLSILSRHDVAIVAEPLSAYRVHGGTVTSTTSAMVLLLEVAYCHARALRIMETDDRFSAAERAALRRDLRILLFETFVDPLARIPEYLHFAAEAIYGAVPDTRLRTRLVPTNDGAD